MFSSDSSSRNDDPVVNHSVYNTSTDGLGFFARPSDTLSLPCSIWNSSSSAKSWSSWLVHRIARLWNGPAGQFYVLRNRRNLLTLKGGVDPSRRFGGRREREPSSSGSASPSPRVNPRYKGKSPKPFHASAAAAAASKPSRSKRVRSDSPPSDTSNKRTSGNAASWLYVLNVPQKLSMRTIREEVSKRCDQDQLSPPVTVESSGKHVKLIFGSASHARNFLSDTGRRLQLMKKSYTVSKSDSSPAAKVSTKPYLWAICSWVPKEPLSTFASAFGVLTSGYMLEGKGVALRFRSEGSVRLLVDVTNKRKFFTDPEDDSLLTVTAHEQCPVHFADDGTCIELDPPEWHAVSTSIGLTGPILSDLLVSDITSWFTQYIGKDTGATLSSRTTTDYEIRFPSLALADKFVYSTMPASPFSCSFKHGEVEITTTTSVSEPQAHSPVVQPFPTGYGRSSYSTWCGPLAEAVDFSNWTHPMHRGANSLASDYTPCWMLPGTSAADIPIIRHHHSCFFLINSIAGLEVIWRKYPGALITPCIMPEFISGPRTTCTLGEAVP